MDCTPLRRNRPYRHLWTAQALSAFGAQASMVAIPLAVIHQLNSASVVALVSFTEGIVLLAVLPVAGLAIDRLGYRPVLIFCDVVRVPTLAVMGWAIGTHQLSPALVVVCAAINGAANAPFWPAVTAAVRAVVPDSQMALALALGQARSAVAGILGPLLAAALYQRSPALPMLCAAGSCLVSLACVVTARLPWPTTKAKRPVRGFPLIGGWRFLVAQPFLRHMMIYGAVTNLAFGGIVLVTTTDYVRSGDTTGTGWLFALAGTGNLLGSLAIAPGMHRLAPRALILLLAWNVALFGAVAAALGTGVWSAPLLGLCCVSSPALNVVVQRVLLRTTPSALLGRVQVAFQTAPQLLASVGPMAGAGLLRVTSSHTALIVLAGVIATMTVLTAVTSALRHVPPAHTDTPAEQREDEATDGRRTHASTMRADPLR
ncbi:MFS transporter [Streptomyces chromofuscus]|uniref:MFS transporter n=1 Tax=Streptomyces chromofuscus TaxID=42881 RepID=A0A7M2T7N6_STRCW|nr:MFS transporter [Streptomyces chromofuscus]QOV43698.1 MFS transporter [Streptomyces chromofuscus]GGT35035.1 MFS transporter [Streptomyces chromofuscus]